MAMGIVSSDDFDLEVGRLNSNDNGKIEQLPNKGRGKGNNETPASLRKVIGEEVIESGRASGLGLARAFGISDSSVSAYSAGATSTSSYNNPTRSLTSHLNKVKNKITKRAHSRLASALDSITPEKLAEANLREASGVARDMSVIIKNLEPETDKRDQNSPQFIIYAPQFRKEESFEVIQVSE